MPHISRPAISRVLASGAPIDNEARNIFAGALRNLLESKGVQTHLRVAALRALGRLDEFGREEDWVSKLRDERAVPVLTEWLSSTNYNTRRAALGALDAVEGKAAVAAIRLRLKSEPDLRLKLHMAEVLGRHGIDDGYAFALEHLADPGITPFAARALAAIDDDRTPEYLWKILETSRDTQWNSAALHGLAALRDQRVSDRLVEILSNRRSPLLHAAIIAAHELGEHFGELVFEAASTLHSLAMTAGRPTGR